MEQTGRCTPAELERVMDTYGVMVYRLAYSRLRSVSDAEDIYQDVFLRYFQKRPAFLSEEHRRAWLLRVTINCARNHLASAWFRHTVPLEEGIALPDPEEQRLDEALGCLAPRDRILLHLFYYEGLSAAEMGKLLNRKESTIRTQLTRARRKLAQIMKGEDHVSGNV